MIWRLIGAFFNAGMLSLFYSDKHNLREEYGEILGTESEKWRGRTEMSVFWGGASVLLDEIKVVKTPFQKECGVFLQSGSYSRVDSNSMIGWQVENC